jgi:hypothetical protein
MIWQLFEAPSDFDPLADVLRVLIEHPLGGLHRGRATAIRHDASVLCDQMKPEHRISTETNPILWHGRNDQRASGVALTADFDFVAADCDRLPALPIFRYYPAIVAGDDDRLGPGSFLPGCLLRRFAILARCQRDRRVNPAGRK